MFSSCSSSLGLLRISPFVTLTLAIYLLAFLTSLFRTFSPSSDSAPSRGPVSSEFGEGEDTEENKKGMGLESLWPVTDVHSNLGNVWKDHNAEALHGLFKCLASNDCGKKQAQLVILEAPDFRMALTGWTSGEGIWARSIMEVLKSLGYTYIFARDMNHVGAFHLMLPDLIRAVVCQDTAMIACMKSKDCIRTVENPMGVRLQSLFGMAFFGAEFNPLGPAWSIVPEGRTTDRTYIGYSIEHQCMATPIPKYKEKKRQVWVLAKHHRYFTSDRFPYSVGIFEKASKELNIEFVGAWNDDDKDDHQPVLGVTRLGGRSQLNETEFDAQLIGSLASVGLRDPWISPTPYYSVCYGVPFLNPTFLDGSSQHPYAAEMGEEHGIVSVMAHNDESFITQLRKAITPHDRYIPPRMKQTEMEKRVEGWLQTNWTRKAEEAWEENKERRVGFEHVIL